MAFLISGGTVGILYQQGIGGIQRSANDMAPQNVTQMTAEPPAQPAVTEEDLAATEDAEAIKAEEEAKAAAEEEARLAEEEAKKAEEEAKAAAEEEAKAKEEEEAKAKQEAKEAGAPYYKVKVKSDIGDLNIYDEQEGGEPIGLVSVGTEGYLIDDSEGHRRLVYIDGKICYITKMYTQLTEIPTDEYPDQLLDVTAADAGKDVSGYESTDSTETEDTEESE